MSAPLRPLCRNPNACKSISDRNCSGCNGAAILAEIRRDPERAAAIRRRANAASVAANLARRGAGRPRGIRYDREATKALLNAMPDPWRAILRQVAEGSEIEAGAVLSRSRLPSVVAVRQAVWCRISRERRASLSDIGRRFKRHHATVRFGIRRHTARIAAGTIAPHRPAEVPKGIVSSTSPAPAIGIPERAAWTHKIGATAPEACQC